MARINDSNGISVDNIGKIPFVGIGHMIATPSGYGWLSPEKGSLYLIDGVKCVVCILMHRFFGISMLILSGDIPVKRVYLLDASLLDVILHN
jgi:hypothetical protein